MKNLNFNGSLPLENNVSKDNKALATFFSILLEWANKEKLKEANPQPINSPDSLIQ